MDDNTINPNITEENANSDKSSFSGSILEEVMATKKEESLASFDPGKVIFDVLEQFPERARHIVVKRYGLDGKTPETLEKLGEQYQITRERVRQIESQARKSLSGQAEGEIFGPVQKLLTNIILEHGEAILEEKLLDELLGSQQTSSVAQNSLRLILTVLPEFEPIAEDKELNSAWTNNQHVIDRIKKLADNAVNIFDADNKVLRFKDLYTKIMDSEYG
ncbi:sigma factor-like helix-turn-helix DNA-binding protein, partial [Patescibacteria group bacterium]